MFPRRVAPERVFRLDTHVLTRLQAHRRTFQFFPLAFPSHLSQALTPFFSRDDVPTLVMSRLATAVLSPT
jgi:hypothetical protein